MAAVEPRAALTARSAISRRSQAGRFLRHYLEMCAPMCVGFAVGDVIYLWAAAPFDYSKPFSELPELSVAVVTLTDDDADGRLDALPRIPRRETTEMAAVMPLLALVLLACGWLAVVPRGDLALLEHGLMMPAMLAPMLFRLDLYAGGSTHTRRPRQAEP